MRGGGKKKHLRKKHIRSGVFRKVNVFNASAGQKKHKFVLIMRDLNLMRALI